MQPPVPSSSPIRKPAPRPLRVRDPERCAVSSTYWAATMLLAALEVGQNIDRLARYTGCKRSFVARCARRLVDNGVWQAGKTVGEWTAEREGHPSFWKDVAVAEGKLCRRINQWGEYEWIPVGARLEPLDEALAREEIAPAARYVVPLSSPVQSGSEEQARRSGDTAAVTRQGEESGHEPAATSSDPAQTSPEPAVPSPSPLETPRPAQPQDRLRSLFPDAVWLG